MPGCRLLRPCGTPNYFNEFSVGLRGLRGEANTDWANINSMGNAHRRAVIALGMVLACCTCASALDPSLDISQYAHTACNVGEVLTKVTIKTIVQKPDCDLWLGTKFGRLFRFNGIRSVPWQSGGMRIATALFEGCWSRAIELFGFALIKGICVSL